MADTADLLATASLRDPGVSAYPNAYYAAMRLGDPVHQDPQLGSWLVSRYEDLQTVFADPVTFAAGPGFRMLYARGCLEEFREILERDPAAFAGSGTNGRTGKRYFSVSGRVARPGVYLAPNGITVRGLIELAGGMLPGHELYAYLPGGASGGILPASLADEPLDFDVLAKHGCFIGSAAIVVLSTQDRAVDAARNLMHFFAHESCGKCTPCRAGTAKSVDLMKEKRWNLPLLITAFA